MTKESDEGARQREVGQPHQVKANMHLAEEPLEEVILAGPDCQIVDKEKSAEGVVVGIQRH
jgi:hypothetical protein